MNLPKSLLDCVGQTPLVKLRGLIENPDISLFAKLEGQNPTGSIKDRIAKAIVEDAEKRGAIKPGDTLVEASTGNTAIALAMVARQKGYRLVVVIPQEVAPSIHDVLEHFNVETSYCDQCKSMSDAIMLAEDLARTEGWYPIRQFESPLNLQAHYNGTGPEIAAILQPVDVLVAGIGTGGTLMGTGKRLRVHNEKLKLVGVEPKMGEKLQGLRCIEEGFRPPLLDLDALDARYLVSSADAMKRAREVVRGDGVMAGISSGAALHAAIRYAERMERGNIVVIFSDGAWKYLPSRPWMAAEADDPSLDDTHWW
ncbi:MAG: cysteine synthase family protein [Myxococcota bacterium]|nr:cysteine synthase family protein [Myxococcota bacterium]